MTLSIFIQSAKQTRSEHFSHRPLAFSEYSWESCKLAFSEQFIVIVITAIYWKKLHFWWSGSPWGLTWENFVGWSPKTQISQTRKECRVRSERCSQFSVIQQSSQGCKVSILLSSSKFMLRSNSRWVENALFSCLHLLSFPGRVFFILRIVFIDSTYRISFKDSSLLGISIPTAIAQTFSGFTPSTTKPLSVEFVGNSSGSEFASPGGKSLPAIPMQSVLLKFEADLQVSLLLLSSILLVQ